MMRKKWKNPKRKTKKRSQRLETLKEKPLKEVTVVIMREVLVHVQAVHKHVDHALVHALPVPALNRHIVVPVVAHLEDRTVQNLAVVVAPLHLNDPIRVHANLSREVVRDLDQVPIQDLVPEADTQAQALVVEVPLQIGPTVALENLEAGVRQLPLHTKVEARINPNRSPILARDLAVEVGQVAVEVVQHPEVVVEVVLLCQGNQCLVANIQIVDQMMSR